MTVVEAQVVQCHRLRRDLLVVRLVGELVPFAAGQSVAVTVPTSPHLPRRYSPALPPSRDGKYEFHIREVPAGWVSPSIVRETREGDIWTLDDPAGDLRVDDTDDDVVMVAGGTGLAPMRALLLGLARRPRPPRVRLYVGGRHPRDLYAADMLSLMARSAPWLTVIPVVDEPVDPPYRDEFFDAADAVRLQTAPDSGFAPHEYLVGRVGEVVARRGPYLAQRVLVCGSPAMSSFTTRALVTTGTPAENIRTG
ncbi:FAD-binding oxidoreductase [Rhodococcoides corynebacterioides]|uniref:FAD-binding oxidoreductase n=1 Tax=Nocardiaceae TaxID=85025 RepID=UPI001956F21D|nr:NAD(P)H-flavin reductase [Rhodococcus sp. PvP016]